MTRFRVTYDIVTPESAEHGDIAEGGFMLPGGWRVPPLIGKPTPGVEMSLREAVDLVSAGCMEDSGSWFTEIDGRPDYRTGEEERRAFHPPDNCTAASYARLARLLGATH